MRACEASGRHDAESLWHECELRAGHSGLHRCPCGVYWAPAKPSAAAGERS